MRRAACACPSPANPSACFNECIELDSPSLKMRVHCIDLFGQASREIVNGNRGEEGWLGERSEVDAKPLAPCGIRCSGLAPEFVGLWLSTRPGGKEIYVIVEERKPI